MATFEQTVAIPSTRDYAPPTPDIFAQIANMPNAYYQGQFNKQQREMNDQAIRQGQIRQDIQQTFRGGLPMNADGSIDYGRAVAMLAQKGDTSALWNGSDVMLQQQAAQTPMIPGGAPQAPAAAPAAGPAPRVPVSQGVQGDSGSGTIASLVTDRLPNQDATTGQTIAKIASVMGIDPNANMTPGQMRRAQGLLQKYAPTPSPSAPSAAGGGTGAPAAPLSRPSLASAGGDGAPTTSPTASERVAGAFAALPPSANAGTPAAQPAPPQGAPNGAGSGRTAPPVTPQQAAPPVQQAAPQAQQPQAPVQQAQAQPGPAVPLPVNPFNGRPIKSAEEGQNVVNAINARIGQLAGNKNNELKIRTLENIRSQIQEAIKPRSVGPATTLIGPNGEVVFQGVGAAAMSGTSETTPERIAAADVYRKTGKLPQNLGSGYTGQAEARSIRALAAEREAAEGGDMTEWPQRWQNYSVAATGKRVLEQRATNLRLAENEATSLIPRVRDISAKVSRTQYPNLNSLILAAKKGSGDKDVIKLGVAVESLIPVYARVLKPVGQITEGDTKRAGDILDKAWSDGQINAALDQMQVELEAARESLNKTMEEVRSGKPSESHAAPAKAAPKPDKDGWVTLPNGARIQEVK